MAPAPRLVGVSLPLDGLDCGEGAVTENTRLLSLEGDSGDFLGDTLNP